MSSSVGISESSTASGLASAWKNAKKIYNDFMDHRQLCFGSSFIINTNNKHVTNMSTHMHVTSFKHISPAHESALNCLTYQMDKV